MSADAGARAAPSGTVTFLFTDIEGSTRRWDSDRAAMQDAVRRHDLLVQKAVREYGGYVFKALGDGFCVAFESASDAVAAALAVQRSFAAEDFADVGGLRIRTAIHSGTATERDGDYFGNAVNRTARLLASGHGGQILLSAAASELVRDQLPAGSVLRDLGKHQLKDLSLPEHVYQLSAVDMVVDFPAIRTPDVRPNNLLQELTAFFGRSEEIAEIETLLARRIVTITGSGGVGKTRAALEVAARSLDRFPDGVWFVDLSSITNPSLIAGAIAETAHLELTGGDPLVALAGACERLCALFILDNCEHLLAAAAQTASTLVRRCAGVTILATSRQELGITGEITYRLPSLACPDASKRASMTAEAALQYAAIELFVNRASSVRPGFRLSDGDAPLVSEICARLDGIPLAIELAAARMRMFSAAKLRDLLEERFRLLTGGSRDALPRQQTMRATIDWSFGLLSEHERILLRRLSVFSGGWTVEAAESVCADDVLPAAQIFELQSSLVDKSLVVAEYDRDEPRFHFLESTRAYALEKLVEGGERNRFLRRHCQWIAEFAERAYIRHWEVALARWSPLVEAEQDNICAALAWSIDERDDPLLGGSIAGALIAFWFRRPVVGLEGRRWIETALTLVDEDAHPFVAARLYFALALISAGDRSLKSARRALEMFERLGDSFHVAFSYRQLAMSQLQAGNAAEALDSIDRTIASFQKAGTTRSWPYAVATAIRASALAGLGRDDESRSAFSEALALFAAVGDEHRAAFQRQNLARLEYSCRNYDAALQELRKILQTLGESPYQGIVTLTRAAVAACYVALGRLTDALAEASDAIRLALRNQERRAVTAGIANVAAVAALKGRADEAAQLCGYCDTWYRSADVVCDSIERGTMATLHAALPRSEGDTRLQRFLNEGGLLSEEQAAEAALRVASRWP